jgi:polyhydroxyalkanoate synthesis regulator phasin
MMNPFSNIVQKAFYLGMGLASVAGEKAGSTLNELRSQATKLAEELVERGEMSTDEAKKFVDDLIRQSQQKQEQIKTKDDFSAPRSINIDDEPDSEQTGAKQSDAHKKSDPTKNSTANSDDLDALRAKVQQLQSELRKIQ